MKKTNLPASVRRTLQDTFGIRRLREGQEEVIVRALAGRDTLAIMPTGAGKSPRAEQDASLERLLAGRCQIVFATPERLADPDFITALGSRRIGLLVVDEAHCISQWGHDFRPAADPLRTAASREAA